MVPNIHIDHEGKTAAVVLEELLAILVEEGRLTVSGAIGHRINERVANRKPLPNPLTGDTV